MEAGKKRIWVRGQYVEVTDEVYMAYTQGDRKMRYFENDLKTNGLFSERRARWYESSPAAKIL